MVMRELVLGQISRGQAVQPEQCKQAGVDYDAVLSLYNQIGVRHLKREAKRGVDSLLISNLESANQTESSSNIASILCDLAQKYQVGGYKLSRMYLDSKYGKGSVTPAQFLENPSVIEDHTLRETLINLMVSDPFCSHPSDQLKECMGKEYEEYLITRLQEKSLCFETEAELRSRGKPKTPDILFLIPMATYHCNNPANGLVVVNWIDSKAMFADEETLAEHFEQLRGYTNRYGRGLVIYWHGYVENISASELFQSFDDMIVLSERFPEVWCAPGAGL